MKTQIHQLDDQRRKDLLRTVLSTLEDWELTPQQQLTLLGLPTHSARRSLRKVREGQLPGDDTASLKRLSCILSIQNTLRLIHPHSMAMANYWVTTPHPYLNEATPLQVMLVGGLQGMTLIVDHLNGSGDW